MSSRQDLHLSRLRETLIRFFAGRTVKIVLFGSRARADASPRSDVDIGIIPPDAASELRLSRLRQLIEDSNIPYKVEIINLAETSDSFRRQAMKDAILWKDWN